MNAALEFGGPGLANLNIDERMAIANMSVEAGADTCVFEYDEQVARYIENTGWTARKPVMPDEDAIYLAKYTIDLNQLEPMIAAPPSPANGQPIAQLTEVKVNQVYIGNCSNGTITDLRQAAQVLEGRSISPDVRLIIVPATSAIYRQAAREGLLEILSAAGAGISLPTCGACFGGHMGILGAGETAISTTNRNFRGRMGHSDSKVYLANAWVAAAAAITGKITDPSTIAEHAGRKERV